MTTAPAMPSPGRITEGEHQFALRVYYEDTDAAGIVYYANYLRFAERARSELLRLAEIDQGALRREQGVVFAVRHAVLDYRRPARLDDLLVLRSRLTDLSGASLTVQQDVHRDGECLVAIEVKVVCLRADDGRPVRLPLTVRRRLAAYCQSTKKVE